MRKDVSDVYASEVVPHVDNESILVPADIEDRPARTRKARGRKVLPKLMRGLVVAALHNPVPRVERSLCIRVLLPKGLGRAESEAQRHTRCYRKWA